VSSYVSFGLLNSTRPYLSHVRLAAGQLPVQQDERDRNGARQGRREDADGKGRAGRQDGHRDLRFTQQNNATFLKALCSDLKKACGVGGAVAGTTIELQGDQRDRLRPLLQKKGFTVKG
jgi:hypothetical protein